jgi:hypothetical protein
VADTWRPGRNLNRAIAEGASGSDVSRLDARIQKAEHAAASARAPEVAQDTFEQLVAAISPLIDWYRMTAGASVRVQLNAAAWNSMPHDQQQQIGDEIASMEAVQSQHRTLHLYVYQTEVWVDRAGLDRRVAIPTRVSGATHGSFRRGCAARKEKRSSLPGRGKVRYITPQIDKLGDNCFPAMAKRLRSK